MEYECLAVARFGRASALRSGARSRRDGQAGLKIDKQFEYSTASEAQNRAEREAQNEDCAGADAYMVSEDPNSGEVEPPEFLVRLGNVPEIDDY